MDDMKRMAGVLAAAGALGVGLFIFGSCGHDETTSPEHRNTTRDTPEHLLSTYTKSMEQKSISDYTECLGEDYRFVFLADDYSAAGVDTLAPYWEKTEDVDRTSKMFASSNVYEISFGFMIVQDFSPSDTLRHIITHIDLQVVVDMGEVELTTMWVNYSLLHFTLAKDPGEPSLWVIREIQEQKVYLSEMAGDPAIHQTETTTYGEIKAMFK